MSKPKTGTIDADAIEAPATSAGRRLFEAFNPWAEESDSGWLQLPQESRNSMESRAQAMSSGYAGLEAPSSTAQEQYDDE